MSDVFGATGPEVRQIGPAFPPGPPMPEGSTLSAPPGPPTIPGAGIAAMAGNPIGGYLMQIATMLGINPIQLASSIVQSPEAVAEGLDAAGAPSPDAGGTADAGIGEQLTGSQPIDYGYDPTAGMGVGVQPGLSSPPVPDPASMPAAGTGTDVGIVPTAQAAQPTGDSIGALLAGVRPPSTPQPQAISSPGAPNPNQIQTTAMDDVIRAALAVAKPGASQLTLQDAVRRG